MPLAGATPCSLAIRPCPVQHWSTSIDQPVSGIARPAAGLTLMRVCSPGAPVVLPRLLGEVFGEILGSLLTGAIWTAGCAGPRPVVVGVGVLAGPTG